MLEPISLLLALLFAAAAILYGSVGHAGASAYLAAMALVGINPAVMKPTALVLNILVATLVTARFARAGFVKPRALLPFLVGSVPAAFVGGAVQLPGEIYRPLVGLVLLWAGFRFLAVASRASDEFAPRAAWWQALVAGVVLGLLAGLTGTGGGIFLTPLMVMLGWAGVRYAAGTSAAFILANSISGLAGNIGTLGVTALPAGLPLWLLAVAGGGMIGAELGARRLTPQGVRRALGLVLILAGLKIILVP
ncbi:MAG TPA: sulfite exporter TauE/SafE family protein [Candidatus Limnocylindria bacterium]|nr:sulfite exporter TauE/SafE family protein [Candidatus Limnocylindria bacterium]